MRKQPRHAHTPERKARKHQKRYRRAKLPVIVIIQQKFQRDGTNRHEKKIPHRHHHGAPCLFGARLPERHAFFQEGQFFAVQRHKARGDRQNAEQDPERPQYLIKSAEQSPCRKRREKQEKLLFGIDLHQPKNLPRSPRFAGAVSPYQMPPTRPSIMTIPRSISSVLT